MRFTGTTVCRVENGKIAEEIGLDDGVTGLLQLRFTSAACSNDAATIVAIDQER
jgi:hypothetical protein